MINFEKITVFVHIQDILVTYGQCVSMSSMALKFRVVSCGIRAPDDGENDVTLNAIGYFILDPTQTVIVPMKKILVKEKSTGTFRLFQ